MSASSRYVVPKTVRIIAVPPIQADAGLTQWCMFYVRPCGQTSPRRSPIGDQLVGIPSPMGG
jgi:hypothetical protein